MSVRPLAERTVLAAALLVLAGGCGGDATDRVEGVVIDVSGDLETVESFTIRTSDGLDLVFEPAPTATFHEGPLVHLTDHLRSGEPVAVTYEEDGSRLVALEVSD